MKLTINGESRVFSAETLSALIEELRMRRDRVAVELNREIVPRDRWDQTRLKDEDQLEIVHFVGGGGASGYGFRCKSRVLSGSLGVTFEA